jgi:CubicO group peptidase (beta-lactamase class C family)
LHLQDFHDILLIRYKLFMIAIAPMRFPSSRASLIAAIGTALLACSPAAALAAGDDPFANLDAHAAQALDDWKTPAMAISIVKDGRVVLARGYGVRKLGGNARVEADTVFPIASVTKAFNATALAMLVDEGRVQWTDPVIKHIPEFKLLDPWMTREVTLADCVTHRTTGSCHSAWKTPPRRQSRSPMRFPARRSGHSGDRSALQKRRSIMVIPHTTDTRSRE